MILVNARSGRCRLVRDRAEAQRIHHRDRPRAHGKDVAQNAADAGGRALKRLDERSDDCAIRS